MQQILQMLLTRNKKKLVSFIQLFYTPKKHKKQLLHIKSIKQQAL